MFFFPSKQWQLMASTLPGSMSGSASWKVHCRRFLCQNSVKLYAMGMKSQNYMKILKSYETRYIMSSKLGKEFINQSFQNIAPATFVVEMFLFLFIDLMISHHGRCPRGAEYKVHRYFLEAFEQVPKHLCNPR